MNLSEKIRIALLYGGTSVERDISLQTGQEVYDNLDKNRYDVKKYDPKYDLEDLFLDCKNGQVDLCFIALHGSGGEDGSIQGMLDSIGIKYTGSGVLASSIAMNKIATKRILDNGDIKIAKDVITDFTNWKANRNKILDEIEKNIKLPCFIKPNISGSSLGMTLAKNIKEVIDGINNALRYDKLVIIEEYIKGLELTVPVLENETLPIIEIIPDNDFFDYESKYTIGKCQEIVPARINEKMYKKAEELSLLITKKIDCRGLSRVDFILRENDLYLLEVNTIPGMTKNSLCPKSAKAANIEFSKLLDKIINLSL